MERITVAGDTGDGDVGICAPVSVCSGVTDFATSGLVEAYVVIAT